MHLTQTTTNYYERKKSMNKRNENITPTKLYVGIDELKTMLSIGRNSALIVGEKANAKIKVGRRTLYNVEKIKDYMASL